MLEIWETSLSHGKIVNWLQSKKLKKKDSELGEIKQHTLRSQKYSPQQLPSENTFSWCIRELQYIHFHGDRTEIQRKPRYPSLGEISRILWIYPLEFYARVKLQQ